MYVYIYIYICVYIYMYIYIHTIARSHISSDSSMCRSVPQCGTVRIHIILVHTITRSHALFDSSVCCSVLQCVAVCKHTSYIQSLDLMRHSTHLCAITKNRTIYVMDSLKSTWQSQSH